MTTTIPFHALDITQLTNLPSELQEGVRFVDWRHEFRNHKPTKIPVDPHTGKDAESDNPATWCTLTEAVAFYMAQMKWLCGVGRMFDLGDLIIGIDFDRCLDELGDLNPDHPAAGWLPRFDSYSEISPSNTGVKTWIRGSHVLGGKTGRRDAMRGVEIYRARRYFTITGRRLVQFSGRVESRQSVLDEFYREFFGAKEQISQTPVSLPISLSDAQIIDLACRARNGGKFHALWSGDLGGYGSHSEADAALCSLLWFWSHDRETVRRLVGQSALGQRKKWQRRDYQERTINFACRGAVYVPFRAE
jgi:primase-polymerase (primpol)-like protein